MTPHLRPLLVISPHLDDAVLGCGALLDANPGAIVVTALAGFSRDPAMQTEWDSASGFGSASEAVAARRSEDQRALTVLMAEPRWLDFRDSQYGDSPSRDTLAEGLQQQIASNQNRTVLLPLGLFHCDHQLVSDAALIAVKRSQGCTCYLYEDAIYRQIEGVVDARIAELKRRGFTASETTFHTGHFEWKRFAIDQYGSQLRALDRPDCFGHQDAFLPERYWRLNW